MHEKYVHLRALSSERRLFSVKYDMSLQKHATAQTRHLLGDECRKYDISHFERGLLEKWYFAFCEIGTGRKAEPERPKKQWKI